MKRTPLLILTLTLLLIRANAQTDESYLKANAILIDNPEKLDDRIYTLLSKFPIILFGEIHGTNESAPFVSGLTNLFISNGDSVQVGLEIPSDLMTNFLSLHTDNSIYLTEFFNDPPFMDGKESVSWAKLISTLNKHRNVNLFFFDINNNEGKPGERDSIMAAKIKAQFNLHPTWRMITLGGNYHNLITNPGTMASILKRNIETPICSINMEYKEGTANANFKNGMEIKQLGSYPSVINSTEGYDRYFLLYSAFSTYNYDGIYYTKYISAAEMTPSKK